MKRVFVLIAIAAFITRGFVLVADDKSWVWFVALSVIFIFCIVIFDTYKRRRELKRKGLPVPKCFCKWKSQALSDIRIRQAFAYYEEVPSATIEGRIAIATKLIKESLSDPFTYIESLFKYVDSFFKYFVIPSLSVVVALWINALDDDNRKNLYPIAVNGFWILVYIFVLVAVLLFARHWFKRMYLEWISHKKVALKGCVFMLENILSLRS